MRSICVFLAASSALAITAYLPSRTGGDAQLRLMAACLAHLFDQPVLEFLQHDRAGIPEHLAAGVHPQHDRCRRFGPVKALAGCAVAEQL
nr:hypothetical protein [Xanthomonas sp. BRIP62418]